MKKHVLASILLAAAAALLWVSSRMTWFYVDAFDDKSGAKTHSIVGSNWASELVALALVLAAASVAAVALRRTPRRIIGVIAAMSGAVVGWSAVAVLLVTEPDRERALNILSSQAATSHRGNGALLSSWAEITAMTLNPVAVIMAIAGAVVAIFAGVLLAVAPGENKTVSSAYDRKQQRKQKIQQELATEPDSGRVLWDALDADIDPTDTPR